MFIYKYIHKFTYIHIYITCLFVHVYIYICVYIYIYIADYHRLRLVFAHLRKTQGLVFVGTSGFSPHVCT